MHATRMEISAPSKVENRRVYCLPFESLHPRFYSHVIKFENIRFQLSKRIRKSVGYKGNIYCGEQLNRCSFGERIHWFRVDKTEG